jgi:hypothetical protein
MKESETAAAEAVEILSRELFKLPAGVRNGTVDRLVDAIVRAAVARVAEATESKRQQSCAICSTVWTASELLPCPVCSQRNLQPTETVMVREELAARVKPHSQEPRPTLGLARRDRK